MVKHNILCDSIIHPLKTGGQYFYLPFPDSCLIEPMTSGLVSLFFQYSFFLYLPVYGNV